MKKSICAVLGALSLLLLIQGAAYAASAVEKYNCIETDSFIIGAYNVAYNETEIVQMSDAEFHASILTDSQFEARDIKTDTPIAADNLIIDFGALRRDVNPDGYPIYASVTLPEIDTATITFWVYITRGVAPTPPDEPTPSSPEEPTTEIPDVSISDFLPKPTTSSGSVQAPVSSPEPKPIHTPRPTFDASLKAPSTEPIQEQEAVSDTDDVDNRQPDEGKDKVTMIAGIVIITEFTATGMLGAGIYSDLRLLRWYEKKKMRK